MSKVPPMVAEQLTAKASPPVNSARERLLNGPILSTLLLLAWPTVAVLLAQTAVTMAEAYYVGLLGTAALAGVALVFPFYMLMVTMSAGGIGSGVASAVARAVGAGNGQDADSLLMHSIILAAFIGLSFTAAALLLGPVLYHVMGGRDTALAAALEYSNYLFLGAVPMWIVNLISASLRGSGNVKVPAIITLTGALILIPVSPALIFGFGPIPAMGIAGAGIAFAIYYVAAAVFLVRYMMSGKANLSIKKVAFEWRLIREIMKVGIPAALSTVMTNLIVILITGAVGLAGTDALAAFGIASRLDYVMIPLLFGLSAAVLTMVGINVGAGRIDRARRVAWIGMLVGTGFVGVIGLIVAIFPMLWLQFFSTDPAVLEPAKNYLHIVAPFYAALGFGFVFGFAAQGAGHAGAPFLAITTRMLLATSLSWLAALYLEPDLTNIAIATAFSLVAYALVSYLAMLKGIIRAS
ncbi:MATE family efflux transporter [Pseudomonas capsici]|uniref:MATE family efflux transporter n=1 Tax=Pseudomonas capsici TaxID=2810614 RepID=UPI0021F14F05|nr:MATE family efflux transporter [Pseudomonas capsici]MCV4342216.1 MATE family efflux transporter [Pseudomonas capsici]